jgi:hypothetical protein
MFNSMAASRNKGTRKRHVQQELFRRGGKRKGAGRKPKHGRAGTTHEERRELEARHPLHIVLRVLPEIGNLRRPELYRSVREASVVAAIRGPLGHGFKGGREKTTDGWAGAFRSIQPPARLEDRSTTR